MPEQYIVISGGLEVEKTLPAIDTTNVGGVLSRFWEHWVAFDSDTEWHLVITQVPHFNLLARFLARTFYSPTVHVDSSWEPCGQYDKAKLMQQVRRALETDDDIIQQWFSADEVMNLLGAATSFEETVIAVRAIRGEHETDTGVLAYVQRTLGKDWA